MPDVDIAQVARPQRPPRTPREHALDPDAFGRTTLIEWSYAQSGKTERYAALVAAQLQHQYAVAIRRRLAERGSNLAAYARASEVTYDRLTKIMRGAVSMNLADVARAELLLGDILAAAVTDKSQGVLDRTKQRFQVLLDAELSRPPKMKPPHG